jgi:peptidoglycan/xylan/chitin deacetylase (PgdA/CDA1 family)
MLEVLDNHRVPCTASINVGVFDHYPEVASAAVDRDWDFMSHGMYNTRYLTGLARDEELDLLHSCNRVLARHTGKHFDGMLGPNITGNWWTPDLMAEVGMRYQGDWVHDERPTPLVTSSLRPFVAMPYNYELNDAPLMMRSYVEGATYVELVKAQFARLLLDSATGGRLMCVTLHPFAMGQPHRIRYLNELLGHLAASGDVWFARAREIVDYYVANYWRADLEGAGVVSDA